VIDVTHQSLRDETSQGEIVAVADAPTDRPPARDLAYAPTDALTHAPTHSRTHAWKCPSA